MRLASVIGRYNNVHTISKIQVPWCGGSDNWSPKMIVTPIVSVVYPQENYGAINSPQSNQSHRYTVAPIPLNPIQPTTGCGSSSRYRTPSPTLLLEEVGELRLSDHNEVRRCLFPDSFKENNEPPYSQSRGGQSVDCPTPTVGKKLNRNRLKRLWWTVYTQILCYAPINR